MTVERRRQLRDELDTLVAQAKLVRLLAQDTADRIDALLLALTADRLNDDRNGDASSG